jgi:hypothetical protein
VRLNYPFLGYDDTNLTRNFSGGDEEESFLQNLKTQPDDWYYRNADITYSYNEYGHRCKNIAELDLDNYILFAGCSHTEGVGLELEKTYVHKVSTALGCDYYNLAKAGTGIDAMIYNLNMWFLLVQKKPKYMFVQWPDETRFTIIHGVDADPCGFWKTEEDFQKFLYYGDKIDFFLSRKTLAEKNTQLMVDESALININVMQQKNSEGSKLILHRDDFARDLSHPGIQSHEELTNDILAYIR